MKGMKQNGEVKWGNHLIDNEIDRYEKELNRLKDMKGKNIADKEIITL